MNYIYIFIFLLILLVYNRNYKIESLTAVKNKSNKRLIDMDSLTDANDKVMQGICKNAGYGYDKLSGSCKHISKATCIKDHPGYVANPEDLELFRKYSDSPCKQQLESFNPVKTEVGEWLVATEEDKKNLIKIQKEVKEIEEEYKKDQSEKKALELFKANAKLMRAERDGEDRCQYSDQSFKHWCLRNKLKYTPHKDGIGKCEVTERYCRSKIMNWDPKNKDCKKKDKTAEFLFGSTLTRSIQASSGDKEVWDCKVSPCYKDEWCAGAGICKPITNPGQSCWSGHDESCWCKSTCKTPFNSQAIEKVAVITGAVLALAAATIATGGAVAAAAAAAKAAAAGVAAGTILVGGVTVSVSATSIVALTIAGTIAFMATGAMAARATQLSMEAARCGAGKDGINIPGGKNGDKNYMALGTSGCCSWYHCPPEHYCPIGNGPCKKAKDPGELCLGGQHSWCKGASKCIIGWHGARCSAGKDGLTPVGKQYKKVRVKRKNMKPHPLFKKRLEDYKNREEVKNDTSMMNVQGMIRPPNQIPPEIKDVFVKDNGNSHYMSLNASGCSPSFPCPPGYYCPVGNGKCRPAKPPGSYCIVDSWCQGRSKCMSSMSKCSCGKDGINAPGPLYYKDKKGKDIKEKGMIYDNGDKHYVCNNSIGCDITNILNKPAPGYYCKSAFNTPREAKMPGGRCLFPRDNWCKGGSECLLGWDLAKCGAGEDGINPAGTLSNLDFPKVVEEEYTWKGEKFKIKYDKRYIEPYKVLNKQIGTSSFIKLGEHGCDEVTGGSRCPTHVKNGDTTDNYHCEVAWKECQPPKDPGEFCLASKDHWCKENRCKGSVCSTKIAGKWYTPYDGRCWAGSDNCEPDTYCGTPPAGSNKGVGMCKFGQPKGWDKFATHFL